MIHCSHDSFWYASSRVSILKTNKHHDNRAVELCISFELSSKCPAACVRDCCTEQRSYGSLLQSRRVNTCICTARAPTKPGVQPVKHTLHYGTAGAQGQPRWERSAPGVSTLLSRMVHRSMMAWGASVARLCMTRGSICGAWSAFATPGPGGAERMTATASERNNSLEGCIATSVLFQLAPGL